MLAVKLKLTAVYSVAKLDRLNIEMQNKKFYLVAMKMNESTNGLGIRGTL